MTDESAKVAWEGFDPDSASDTRVRIAWLQDYIRFWNEMRANLQKTAVAHKERVNQEAELLSKGIIEGPHERRRHEIFLRTYSDNHQFLAETIAEIESSIRDDQQAVDQLMRRLSKLEQT